MRGRQIERLLLKKKKKTKEEEEERIFRSNHKR